MDIFEARVSEYAGRKCAERIPVSYAVKKPEYIEDRKQTIKKIDEEINDLKKRISEFTNTESYFYKEAVKRLKKCCEIKQNCEASIVLAKKQIEIAKRTCVR